ALELLRLRFEHAETDEERAELLQRVAEIQERELSRPDEALKTYGELFILDPRAESVAKHFAHLCEALNQWDRLAAYFDRALQDIDIDDEQTIRIAKQAAEIFEERLGNFEKATENYERVHRFDP